MDSSQTYDRRHYAPGNDERLGGIHAPYLLGTDKLRRLKSGTGAVLKAPRQLLVFHWLRRRAGAPPSLLTMLHQS
jgi:hypothetical protein